MKKALWCIVGTIFLLSTLAFAVDKPVSLVTVDPLKTNLQNPLKCMPEERLLKFPMKPLRLNVP